MSKAPKREPNVRSNRPKMLEKPSGFRKLSPHEWIKISLPSLKTDLKQFITPFFVIYEFTSKDFILDFLIDICKENFVCYTVAEYSYLNKQSSLIKNRIELRGHSIKVFFNEVLCVFYKKCRRKIKFDDIYRTSGINKSHYVITTIKNKRILGFISENGITADNLNGKTIAKDKKLCRTIRNHINAMISFYKFSCHYAFWEFIQHQKQSGVFLKFIRLSFAAPIDAENAKKELLGVSLLESVCNVGKKSVRNVNNGDLELVTDREMFEMYKEAPLLQNVNEMSRVNMKMYDFYCGKKSKKSSVKKKKRKKVVEKVRKDDVKKKNVKKKKIHECDKSKSYTDLLVMCYDGRKMKFNINLDEKIGTVYKIVGKSGGKCNSFVLKKWPGRTYNDKMELKNMNATVGDEGLRRCLVFQEKI